MTGLFSCPRLIHTPISQWWYNRSITGFLFFAVWVRTPLLQCGPNDNFLSNHVSWNIACIRDSSTCETRRPCWSLHQTRLQNTLLPASTLSPHHHCEHASLDQPHLISSLQNTATLTPLYCGSLDFLSNHFEAQWQSNLILIFHVSSTNCRRSQLSQLLSGG